MKVVLLTSNSIQNFALSYKIAQDHELVGIVYENRFNKGNRLKNYLKKNNYNFFKVAQKLYEKYLLKKLDSSFSTHISQQYKEYKRFYPVPVQEVSNVNDDKTLEFLKSLNFDIILVSGTHIVKKKVLSVGAKYGIINMHTGLSPYYNGGPSCTFWCLYNEDINHIGSTVMFIDEGIDTGNIVLTDTVVVEEEDNYGTLEFKAIELGHKLILKALKKLEANPKFKGYKQGEIISGKTYYTKDFTFERRMAVLKKLEKGTIKHLLMSRDAVNNIIKFPE